MIQQTQAPFTYECLGSCPNISYWVDYDDNNTCIPCHFLCARCVGSGNSECTQCKAVSAEPVELDRTVTVDGVNRTLYTCRATSAVTSGQEK